MLEQYLNKFIPFLDTLIRLPWSYEPERLIAFLSAIVNEEDPLNINEQKIIEIFKRTIGVSLHTVFSKQDISSTMTRRLEQYQLSPEKILTIIGWYHQNKTERFFEENIVRLANAIYQLSSSMSISSNDLLDKLNLTSLHIERDFNSLINVLELAAQRRTIVPLLSLLENYPKNARNTPLKSLLFHYEIVENELISIFPYIPVADIYSLLLPIYPFLEPHNDRENAGNDEKTFLQYLETLTALCRSHPQTYLIATHYLTALHNAWFRDGNVSFENVNNTLNTLLKYSKQLNNPLITNNILLSYQCDPKVFYYILEALNKIEIEAAKNLLIIISSQVSADATISDTDVNTFIAKFNSEQIATIATYFQDPPYPRFKDLLELDPNNIAVLGQKKADPFNIRKDNDFDIKTYDKKKGGVILETIPSGQDLSQKINEYRVKSYEELKLLLDDPNSDLMTHIVVLGELLRLSNGQTLNESQYLGILAILQGDQRTIAGMPTGWGKSRAMMIVNAYLASKGRTVDFTTANMQLAERDFYTYQAFFDLCGIQTKLISRASSKDEYTLLDENRTKGAVHFSTVPDLALFRGRHFMHDAQWCVETNVKQRALVCDEADAALLDSHTQHFNNTEVTNDTPISDTAYQIIVEALHAQYDLEAPANHIHTITEALDYNADLAVEMFNHYLADQLSLSFNRESLQLLMKLSPAQKLELIKAAKIAGGLKESNEENNAKSADFALQDNVDVDSPTKGIIRTNIIVVLNGGRGASDFRFSAHVHQCLAVIMSKKYNKKYYIPEQQSIMLTTSAHHTFQLYPRGSAFIGSTGTLGSPTEQQELQDKYGLLLLHVPLQHAFQGDFQGTFFAGKKHERIGKALRRRAEKSDQPILVIGENDGEVSKLRVEVNLPNRTQTVSALSTTEDERAAIGRAGQAKQITYSNERMARGTDIRTNHSDGIHVAVLGALPVRRKQQAEGRAARFGQSGSYEQVLTHDQLFQLTGKSNPETAFYLYRDAYLANVSAQADLKQALMRALNETLSDYQSELSGLFFKWRKDSNGTEDELATINAQWANFLAEIKNEWGTFIDEVSRSTTVEPRTIALRARELMRGFSWEIKNHNENNETVSIQIEENTKERLRQSLNGNLQRILNAKQSLTKQTMRTMKFNNYHYSHNGQATIYRQLFAETRAFLRGERQWFANTRAWLQGIGALFANTRAMLFYLFSFGQRGRMPFANLCASLGNKEMDAGMPTSLQFTPAPTISLAAGSVTVNIHTSIPPAGGDSVKTSRIK